ncbi:DUF378 domain-containing protein [Candidatus Nomurabacteria bacterium]|nr:DUF378 domain-containing protein [Candidatus Nomurabacteria bacterium]
MCNGNYWAGCAVSKVVKVLLLVGGLNWGLVGAGMLFGGSDWNLVYMLLGGMPTLEGIVYLLVGVAGVMSLFHCKCAKCKALCVCGTGNQGGGMQ